LLEDGIDLLRPDAGRPRKNSRIDGYPRVAREEGDEAF